MVPGHWETIEASGGHVPAEALLALGWSPEQLLKAFEARTLHAFGGKESGLLIPRHQFDDQLVQLDLATVRKRVMALPRVIAALDDFRPCADVARELKLPVARVKAWADAGLIAWRPRNQ